MVSSTPGKALTGLRLAVGAGAWLAPNATAKLFGMDPDANPQASYLGRLFGVRDVALAIWVGSCTGDARRLGWKVGVGCDLADAAAGVLAARGGTLPLSSAVMATATALAAAGLGAGALAADDA